MKTVLIGPSELDPGAVVPQCLDVHYVSDEVISRMLREGRDYHDPKIVELRQRDVFLEYRRSLVYTRQTVINRAFFVNPLIYEDFEERKDNEVSRSAFRFLLESGAIVPFLLKGSDFINETRLFTSSKRAIAAVESLNNLVSELHSVRLSVDDVKNEQESERLDQVFRSFAVSLGEIRRSPMLLKALAVEVFGNRELSHQELEGFAKALLDVSSFSLTADELNRTVLYHQFITEGDHNEGRFRRPSANPYMLAQKKVLDLRYNTGLPDLLQRFALTPRGLPTHAAVDYVVPTGHSRTEEGDELLSQITDRAATRLMSDLQHAFYLPALSELTIADVYEARRMPEWQRFVDAQGMLLGHAAAPFEYLPEVMSTLEEFQRVFSSWYYKAHPDARPLRRFNVVLTLALQILGVTLAVLSTDASLLQQIVIGTLPVVLSDKVKGFMARLLVNFVDHDTGRIDPDHSYSLDLLRSGKELSRGDVQDLIRRFEVQDSHSANAGAPD